MNPELRNKNPRKFPAPQLKTVMQQIGVDMKIFIQLGKWAKRQGENYSTELFAFILSYLLKNDQQFGFQILGFLTDGFFTKSNTLASEISISTQVRTEHGTPDIEIRSPSAITIIEVKAGSPLGKKQLESYRKILNKSGVQETQLILLTKYVSASGTHKPDYALRWFQLAEKLEELRIEYQVSPVSDFLLDGFLEFLRSRNMALVEVRSTISSAINSHEEEYGDNSIIFKRVRSPSRLDQYPELSPLRNLLQMMGEALDATGYKSKPSFDSGKHQGGWIGYNLDGTKYFFCIYYTNPEEIVFETYLGRGDIRPEIDIEIGAFVTRNGNSYWENRMDVSARVPGFLALRPSEQLELLKRFCSTSLAQAIALQSAA